MAMQHNSFLHELVVSALVVGIAAGAAHIATRVYFNGGSLQWLLVAVTG